MNDNAPFSDIRVVVHDHDDPPPFPDLAASQIIDGEATRAAVLRGGTAKGRASVAILADLPDGRVIVIQTTARLLHMLAAAARGAQDRWGEPHG